jgi:hypothetical protein
MYWACQVHTYVGLEVPAARGVGICLMIDHVANAEWAQCRGGGGIKKQMLASLDFSNAV